MNVINNDRRSRPAVNSYDTESASALQREIVVENAVIESMAMRNGTGHVTISYGRRSNNRTVRRQMVTLIVGRDTRMRDQFGNRIGFRNLREGMVVNARFSSVMTRSNPPQARAFSITIVKENKDSLIEEGRVISVDVIDNFGYILTGNRNNINRQMRYVVSNTTKLRDRRGNRITFRAIRPGQIIRVERASFQTASIPPQTSAITVQIISR